MSHPSQRRTSPRLTLVTTHAFASVRPALRGVTWDERPAYDGEGRSRTPGTRAVGGRSMARIGFALLVTAVFSIFQLVTWPLFEASPFLLFCAGAAIAACVAGWTAGLVTTVSSAMVAQYLFVTPRHLVPSNPSEALGLAGFLATGILISMLVARLERDRAHMARVLESVADGFVSLDREGRCRYVNEAAAALDGRSAGELLGRPFDLAHGVASDVPRARADGPSRTETYVPRLERWLEVTSYAADDGATLLFRDVTERREVEEALRRSERRIRALLDQAIMGVAQTDLSGRFVLANRRFCDLAGRSEAALLNLRLKDVSHPEDRAAGVEALRGVAERGEADLLETRFRRPDGSVIWVRNHLVAVRDDAGRAHYALAIVEDISDRKRIERENRVAHERERVARGEAETASRAKDEFLAMISHELRAPLTAIVGWLRLIHDGNVDAAGAPRALETIERNAASLSRLVNDLLDVSSIVSGKLELDRKPVEPAPVLRSAIDAVQPLAQRKQIEIALLRPDDVEPVLADATRLHQILWNLLANAVKFTPHGGRVEAGLRSEGDDVVFTVADNGIGIDAQFLPHVFDRFRQHDSSYARRYTGLGLGLAIARQLAQMHGGDVAATSAGEGQGATFTVRLPRAGSNGTAGAPGPAAADRPAADEGPPAIEPGSKTPPEDRADRLPSLEGLRILVVDDEPDARSLVVEILTRRGATVRSCPSASEGRSVLEEWTPDVLVSDIGLPEESGYTFIRTVRALGPERGGDVPAIALTGYARLANRLEALSAGYDLHIAKPVEPSELILMVASVAGRLEDGPLGDGPPRDV